MVRAPVSSREAGLSLVEVIAAVAILAVLTSAVVVYWSVGFNPARDAADRLTLRLAEAREHVLVTGETLGFASDLDGSGWRFFRFRDGAWTVIRDHPALRPERLGGDLRLRIRDGALPRRNGDAAVHAPEVLFDPGGFDAPFSYELRAPDDLLIIRRTDAGRLVVCVAGGLQGGAA